MFPEYRFWCRTIIRNRSYFAHYMAISRGNPYDCTDSKMGFGKTHFRALVIMTNLQIFDTIS